MRSSQSSFAASSIVTSAMIWEGNVGISGVWCFFHTSYFILCVCGDATGEGISYLRRRRRGRRQWKGGWVVAGLCAVGVGRLGWAWVAWEFLVCVWWVVVGWWCEGLKLPWGWRRWRYCIQKQWTSKCVWSWLSIVSLPRGTRKTLAEETWGGRGGEWIFSVLVNIHNLY